MVDAYQIIHEYHTKRAELIDEYYKQWASRRPDQIWTFTREEPATIIPINPRCAYCGVTADHITGTCDHCGAPLEVQQWMRVT